MTNSRQSSLRVLLAVHSRREELAERALAKVTQQAHKAREHLECAQSDVQRMSLRRTEDVQTARTGADHRHEEKLYRELRSLRIAAEEEASRLEEIRREHLDVYKQALQYREVTSNLLERRLAQYEAALNRAEQRRMDDLSGARIGRKEYTRDLQRFRAEE